MGTAFEWVVGGIVGLILIGLVACYAWPRVWRRRRSTAHPPAPAREPIDRFGEPVRARDMRVSDIQRVVQWGLDDVIRPDENDARRRPGG